jgi:flagellar motor switch protein FliN/FliY
MADEIPKTGDAVRISAAEMASGLARADSPFENLELTAGGANGDGNGHALEAGKLDIVLDIPLRLSVELGRAELPIREVMRLGRGSMVELDRGPGAPLDVRVNGILIGRGEVVVVNEERLGLRFVEVVTPLERAKRLR